MAEVRFIQRHSLLTRIVHCTVAVSCVWLMISGLFVFVPAIAAANPDLTRFMKITHRVVGVVFICMPIIGIIGSPKGVAEFFKKYFKKWTPEDVEFMKKFVPYMLMPKKVHMPDQDEVKSGQRIADGMLVISGLMMAISGLALWLGGSVAHASAETLAVMRFIHDLFFLLMVIFVVAHAFLGGGVFQPYRGGTVKLMFGNGQVSEANALYHWGFWAREELEEGAKIVVRTVPDEDRKRISSKASLGVAATTTGVAAVAAKADEAVRNAVDEAQADPKE
ncbi:MAG: cytochrome b/b6 domain-containing protein [Eggerthellaceae bacterium]|jgi:formate dehydrogenase subunit gamma|nr:cytochrome b/b6 domain-containing protein [Eggerthellaceae bacterium]